MQDDSVTDPKASMTRTRSAGKLTEKLRLFGNVAKHLRPSLDELTSLALTMPLATDSPMSSAIRQSRLCELLASVVRMHPFVSRIAFIFLLLFLSKCNLCLFQFSYNYTPT